MKTRTSTAKSNSMTSTAYGNSAALLIAISFFSGRAVGAAETSPESLLSDQPSAFILSGGNEFATRALVDVEGQAFKEANAVSVRKRAASEYGIQLTRRVPARLAKGDILLLSVWARLNATPDESNEARIGLVLEDAGGKYRPLQRVFGVGKAWQRFDVPVVLEKASEAKQMAVNVRLGYYIQTLEIGGVSLQRYPPGTVLSKLPYTRPSYAGRSPDAAWRVAAAERIEKYRKGKLTVRVINAAGEPVTGAQVRVRQTRHAFAFGSVYNSNLIAGPERGTAAAAIYREKFLQLFNTGVDELKQKWPWWEDPTHRGPAIDSVQWMRSHGIDVRGHVMVWPSWRKTPPSLKAFENDPEQLRKKVIDHINNIGGVFKGQMTEWDVVNEPIVNNDLLNILGENVMADWFKEARRVEPDARLYLNEAAVPNSIPSDSKYDKFQHYIELIQKNGGPIGGIGMQGHFGWTMNSPQQLLEIYDRFAKFGLPIRLTELDIDVDDPALQYDYMRDVLTASFSHASVNGIVNWSFWAGASWKPQAALFDMDWRPTAAGRAWTDLINNAWWTDVQGKTAADGTYQCLGFLGDYTITVDHDGRTETTTTRLNSGEQTVPVRAK